jgi:hypothetical protein
MLTLLVLVAFNREGRDTHNR